MIDRVTNYRSRYGYPGWIALVAEFWWRLEHLPGYADRVEPPMWWQRIVSFSYRQRKAWERRGAVSAKSIEHGESL